MAMETEGLLNKLNLSETDQNSMLHYLAPQSTQGMWVFWTDGTSHSDPGTDSITNKIKSALCDLRFSQCDDVSKILVQFWAIGGDRCALTTSNQPFALSKIDGGLGKYRKHCMTFEIIVDDEVTQDYLGVLGRVFHNKYPESAPDVRFYSRREYPQRDVAMSCDIQNSLAVPVFEPSGQGCVGVLELVDARVKNHYSRNLYDLALNVLKDVASKTCSQLREFRSQRWRPVAPCSNIPKKRKFDKVDDYLTKLMDSPLQNDVVKVTLRFRDSVVIFLLSTSSGISEFLENVHIRIHLEGAYRIKYLNSDCDWDFIDCEKDLHNCLANPKLQPPRVIIMAIDELS